MLLKLQDLFQEIAGVLEDFVHSSVSVAILEALATAAGTDVVAADTGEVQGLGPAKWRPHRRRGVCPRWYRRLRARDVRC